MKGNRQMNRRGFLERAGKVSAGLLLTGYGQAVGELPEDDTCVWKA